MSTREQTDRLRAAFTAGRYYPYTADAGFEAVQALAESRFPYGEVPDATRATSDDEAPLVGRCCIDAYILGWNECADEYEAPSRPSARDIAARIAEARE